MRAQEEAGLTDNAWVERIGQLRQMVSDQYDPTRGATPREFVDWLVENSAEEFDNADERILIRAAQYARLDHLSWAIYGIVSGADNRDEIDATQSDIHDWLANGDQGEGRTAEQLAAEYVEYLETAAEAVEE
jgi:hypothetical protein